MKKHPLSHLKNKKMAIARENGVWEIRVYHKKVGKHLSPRYLLKCGCCDKSVELLKSTACWAQ